MLSVACLYDVIGWETKIRIKSTAFSYFFECPDFLLFSCDVHIIHLKFTMPKMWFKCNGNILKQVNRLFRPPVLCRFLKNIIIFRMTAFIVIVFFVR